MGIPRFRPNTRIGFPCPGQIIGRCYPSQGCVSASGQKPGWGYTVQAKYKCGVPHFRSNTRTGNPVQTRYHTALSLPGMYYHLGAKYQIGVTPFSSNTRGAYALQIKYQAAVIPQVMGNRAGLLLQIKYQEAGCHLLAENQGGSPLQIKYQGLDTPFKSYTRPALSSRGGIPERGFPSRSNTRE